MPKPKDPKRGESCQTVEGRSVIFLKKQGDAYKVLNEKGMIELIYPRELKSQEGETH